MSSLLIQNSKKEKADQKPVAQSGNVQTAHDLEMHIKRCGLNNRDSQKEIYRSFYSYAMAVCVRYADNRDDAIEILNDGFLKVFKQVGNYKIPYPDSIGSFKAWLRRIMTNTAIDHFRRNKKYRYNKEPDNSAIELVAGGEDVFDRISYTEIINSIQQLTPGYRAIFNLFIIEGYTYEEIAQQLGISIGASKSSMYKARRQLQNLLLQKNKIRTKKMIQRMIPAGMLTNYKLKNYLKDTNKNVKMKTSRLF